MKKTIAVILCSLTLVLVLTGCSSAPEAATLKDVYNAKPSTGTWLLFGDMEFTNVRTQQVHLYSDGKYVLQDVTYEIPFFGQDTTGRPFAPNVITVTTFGTYTIEEDAESEGKSALTLGAADRILYSGSDVFFPDSYGSYDSADASTAEAFTNNTIYGNDIAKLKGDYGSEKVYSINTQTHLIENDIGNAVYQEGHITFNQKN